MGRHKKITWNVIFKDFKGRHPKLSKNAIHFEPYDYATILIWFVGGKKMTYDYDSKLLSRVVD